MGTDTTATHMYALTLLLWLPRPCRGAMLMSSIAAFSTRSTASSWTGWRPQSKPPDRRLQHHSNNSTSDTNATDDGEWSNVSALIWHTVWSADYAFLHIPKVRGP